MKTPNCTLFLAATIFAVGCDVSPTSQLSGQPEQIDHDANSIDDSKGYRFRCESEDERVIVMDTYSHWVNISRPGALGNSTRDVHISRNPNRHGDWTIRGKFRGTVTPVGGGYRFELTDDWGSEYKGTCSRSRVIPQTTAYSCLDDEKSMKILVDRDTFEFTDMETGKSWREGRYSSRWWVLSMKPATGSLEFTDGSKNKVGHIRSFLSGTEFWLKSENGETFEGTCRPAKG